MRKTIAAVTVGLLLVAGQAVASNNTAARVGDRLGGSSGIQAPVGGAAVAAGGLNNSLLMIGGIIIGLGVTAALADSHVSGS